MCRPQTSVGVRELWVSRDRTRHRSRRSFLLLRTLRPTCSGWGTGERPRLTFTTAPVGGPGARHQTTADGASAVAHDVPHIFRKYSFASRLSRSNSSRGRVVPTRYSRRSAPVSARGHRSLDAPADGQGVAGSTPVSPTKCDVRGHPDHGSCSRPRLRATGLCAERGVPPGPGR
jgi:hypothetical protein